MGLWKVALFASVILGVTGTPLGESKAWQNNSTAISAITANTENTTSEIRWTIFAPVTQVTGLELDLPGDGATSSPVTQRTQLSLEVPESQTSATSTPAPKPIIQPSETSLLIPVATVSDGKTYVTIAPTAHLENPGTILVTPEGGTASPTLGIVGSELVELPANTEPAGSHHGQDDSGASADSNGNAEQHAPATILVGDTPLSAGGSPVTVDGTTYSLEPTGSAVVINGNTVSFSTNSRGQVVPVETATSGQSDSGTNDSDAESLGKLSVVSAAATATGTGEGAQGTASATSTRNSGTNGSPEETGSGNSSGSSNGNSDDEDAEATGTSTSEDAPEMQSDNAGTVTAAGWPLPAMLGVVGLFAAMA